MCGLLKIYILLACKEPTNQARLSIGIEFIFCQDC